VSERDRLLTKAQAFSAEKERQRELAEAAVDIRDRHEHNVLADAAWYGERFCMGLAEMAAAT
jgi:hypothetical protein